jgi:DNA-directed RNA polymerase sigma subunit (sigma70/sigma32)
MAGLIETLNKIVVARWRIQRDTGREPTPEDLAAALALRPEDVREALEAHRKMFTVNFPSAA